jgi:uncharacterized membrane protein YdjX (TVP38/TMEM64 family)
MSAQTSNDQDSNGGSRWTWHWVGILLAIIAAAIYFGVPTRAQDLLRGALDAVRELGTWGPVTFILLYVVACVALLPASILTMGGGALYGVLWGSIYVSIAATLGATAAFLVGRYLARDWIIRKVGANPSFVAIDRAVADEGWRIVLLTRLCPLFPFFLLNYAFGLTRISLRHYVLATWMGIIPGSMLFVYLGSLANTGSRQPGAMGWAWRLFILFTALAAVSYIARVARRALSKKMATPEADSTNATP